MPNSTSQDDSWDELARELGLERPSTPPEEASLDQIPDEDLPPLQDPETDPIEEERPARGHPWAPHGETEGTGPSTDEFEPMAEEVELEEEGGEVESAEEGAAEDGQQGTGRKRRRRRRRRRKGGASPLAATEGETRAGEDFEVSARVEGDNFVESGPEPDEIEGEELIEDLGGEEEDVGGEVLRDLTANWNVPSWDEIVSGLYRPER